MIVSTDTGGIQPENRTEMKIRDGRERAGTLIVSGSEFPIEMFVHEDHGVRCADARGER